MLPIGKDTEFVVVEGHISEDLLEGLVQGLFAVGVTMGAVKSSDNICQIRRSPPGFVLNL